MQINNVFEVAVYPNPFVNTLSIDHNSTTGQVLLVDANGKLVKEEALESTTHNLDVTNIPSGMYYIKIVSGSEYSIQQVIKD